jgi:hypothetical protein
MRWMRRGFEVERRDESHSRNSTTAPIAAAFRSTWDLGDRFDRARRPPPSITQARQKIRLQTLRDRHECPVSEVRALSAAPSLAPPPLTFGLPGKQRVNSARSGPVLACGFKALTGDLGSLVAPDRAAPRARSQGRLSARASFGEHNLVLEEIDKADSVCLERLGIERGLGQSG